jgi:uncharacterized membrane protein
MMTFSGGPLAVAYAVRLAEGLQNFFPWLTNLDCRVLYLHPVLVNFVAAGVPVSLAFDIGSRVFKREAFRAVGAWNMIVAACFVPFVVFFGWLYWGSNDDNRSMAIHFWLGNTLAVVIIALAVWRWRQYAKARPASVLYLICTFITLAALAVQGHIGGSQ